MTSCSRVHQAAVLEAEIQIGAIQVIIVVALAVVASLAVVGAPVVVASLARTVVALATTVDVVGTGMI
ncbi:hypothetical protein V7075_16900 [Neobacillus drentensis]|uniref:hypothetical protein n=1 Tax=Neobacillus drentensis TaxID=220684 RepID=UPI002FFE9181